MADKPMRLASAAKKFNVGVTTLIDFLKSEGHEVANRPTTKLEPELIALLSKEFKKEVELKQKADKIDIGSARKKANPKVEEPKAEITQTPIIPETPKVEIPKKEVEVKKEIEIPTVEPVKQEPKKVEEPKAETKEQTSKSRGPKVLDVIDLDQFKKPKKKAKPVAKVTPTKKAETPKPEPKKEAPTKEQPKEVEKIEVEKPKLTGPKVLDKINLDEFKKPSKKKKEQPKKAEKKAQPTEPKQVVEETKSVEQPKAVQTTENNTKEEPKQEIAKETTSEEQPTEGKVEAAKIETKFKSLTGPKVLGKIELPSQEDKKKKKRKRFVKKVGTKKPTAANKVASGTKTTAAKTATEGDKEKKREKPVRAKIGVRRAPNNFRKGGGGRGNFRAKKNDEPKEAVTEQEIQDKIKATMARMQGKKASNQKGERSKYKREKRKEHAAAREEADIIANEDNTLVVSEFIALNELASLMDVPPTKLITASFSLGMMVTINQRLDAELIQILGEEFGFDIEFASATEDIEAEIEDIDDPADLEPRNAIVTVMGHVDHGKTSLLDYIRRENVIAGEAGGITQHIGAYEVILENDKKITFLDTPGHEAFTAMRARGAKVTDIAIIVIAADDSIMPQTREAISHAQAAEVPMIFAFNKIDKPGANVEKIREELSQMNILVEDWGGEYQAQEISAKHGTNIDELLEKVLLQAELLELQANPNKPAVGTIVEARLDKGRGYVSSGLVQAGTLKVGDFVVAGQYYGKIKAMFNERGKPRDLAGPSVPVELLGLNGAPTAGETFRVYEDESAGKEIASKREVILREQGLKARKHITLDEIGRRLALGTFKELNIIIKGDVDGSVEAMADSLQKLSTEEIMVNIIHKGVGQISESDVLLASASDAIIIAFQVRPSQQARKLAEKEDIELRMYSVIYDAIDDIKAAMEGMLEPKVEERIICNIEIKETFKISKVGTIAGCEVLDGKAKRDMKIRLVRDGVVVYTGELASLKRYKDDVKEVYAGQECGLNIQNFNDIKVGDIVEGYEEIEVKRTLHS